MSPSTTSPEDMSPSQPFRSDHLPPTGNTMASTDTEGIAPAEDPDVPATPGPAVEDELGIEGLPVEPSVPAQKDEGSPQVGNIANSWTWTEDANTPDIFQDLATQNLIDRTTIPKLPLRPGTQICASLLPLVAATTTSSSIEAKADGMSRPSTPTNPGPPAHTSLSLVGNMEEDLRGVGAALPLDSDQAFQDE